MGVEGVILTVPGIAERKNTADQVGGILHTDSVRMSRGNQERLKWLCGHC